ncbi:MAG TPA: hypothetical protein VNH65_06385 [Candidatus Acidoferrum sp.]|nr:hypothetical protein [Candidatus Acidoferrum sp.]
MSLFAFLFVSLPAASIEQPPFVRIVGIVTMAVAMVCSILGIATGIGLFFLRNWARISAMVWAGISFFFGLIGIPIALFMSVPRASNSPALPENFTVMFRIMLLVIYGLPLAVGIWWLILFNRKAIKEQFTRSAPVDPSLSQKPRCPAPIAVLAWFFITSAANVLILPLLPFRAPALLFGKWFDPPAGTVIFIAACASIAVAGVGLLKLKPWSYSLTIGLQLLWLTSGVVTMLTPGFSARFDAMVTNINEALHLPQDLNGPLDYSQFARWGMIGGVVLGVAILVMLLYYRERFLEAASAREA